MGHGGPWWAMGLNKNHDFVAVFSWRLAFCEPQQSPAFGSKRSCKFQIGFYSGDIHPCTSWDFVVDNVYRHKINKIFTNIYKINFCILIICQAYSVRFFPIFNPHNFFQPKNLTKKLVQPAAALVHPSDRQLGLLESAVAVRCSWRRREKIGALVGQRFWTTPMCSLDIDMIIYIYMLWHDYCIYFLFFTIYMYILYITCIFVSHNNSWNHSWEHVCRHIFTVMQSILYY